MELNLFALLLVLCVTNVFADLYLHNPRGSNDRNCERNDNRNNGNRLFDSQNNDKGGYACPRAVGGPEVVTPQMYYYEGSKVQIEWTAQHGCNNPNVDCQIVIQYQCAPQPGTEPTSKLDSYYYLLNPGLRDGTPTDANDAATDTMNSQTDTTNPRYGYHETFDYYSACSRRGRNEGIWISDQDVPLNENGGSARNTRQNPNGGRRGWECPEERDYYPYWHPAPWKDIAVLSSNKDRCSYYQQESQNVVGRYWCLQADGTPAQTANTYGSCTQGGNVWTKVPEWGIPAPECLAPDYSRDNHLGNTLTGYHSKYEWTVPTYLDTTMDKCVLRIRYNISNGNVDWDYDHTMNGENSPIKQDPLVHIHGKDTPTKKNAINVSLAVNTNQYGRTFQDRTYVFSIKKRADGPAPASGTIWNVNVHGKRGNIVDTYPAVEYDFIPTKLEIEQGDYVHFQWTGSDYNPNRTPNAAEGGPVDPANANNYRADRSNIVPIVRLANGIMPSASGDSWFGVLSNEQMVSLAYINQDMTLCMSLKDLYTKHSTNGNVNTDEVERDSQNCMKLNAAKTPYFDLPAPVQMSKTGKYLYMSTRNNNFSNRNQRASITVKDQPMSSTEKAAIGVGAATGAGAAAAAGAFYYKKNFLH